ncbi:enoyl-CoA hydratase-related protein [Neptuniibacter sp. SY11_33]|uniref:enoyl-CoA hydratase-related protein n=1 Tax=Neptuniibacter sp. SY11_33 TaxID=3398215 RepID=UPI0039F493AB
MATVLTEKQGSVFEINLNRPDKKNALTLAMYVEMTALLKQAVEDPNVHVVLFRAQGQSFCAGNDISDFVSAANNPNILQDVLEFLHALASFPKPIIAAVHGDAVGIGTTMLLHCDLVISADNLRCKMPFVQLGLIPEGASTLLFPQLVGHRLAFELLVEGRNFDAVKAEKLGIVNQITEPDLLLETARIRAKNVADSPVDSVIAAKQLMKAETLKSVHQVIDSEGALFYQRLLSEEAQKAFMAFLQK